VEAGTFAARSGEGRAVASVHHGLMSVEHLAGNLESALKHGWQAVTSYPAEEDQVDALASLAGVLIDVGELQAAEDAWSCVAHMASGRDYIRLYALDALSHVAARRGETAKFARRAAEADALDWDSGPAPAKAEILYYRGLSYQYLGDTDEARRWLQRALSFCEAHRFSRMLFRAEEALRRLDTSPAEVPPRTDTTDIAPPEVRAGLEQMRREVVGSGR
jgi:tetratricopeptide (TPR) repeat protein